MFKEFNQLENFSISSQSDFNDSIFSGVDKMLGVPKYDDLLIAISTDDVNSEQVIEKFLFIQSYGENELIDDDIEIFILDDYKFCLIDLYDGVYAIIIKKNNLKNIVDLLKD
jgi:hypothetical protein